MSRYKAGGSTDSMLTMVESVQDIYHQIFPLSANFRPFAIFSSYMVLAIALTVSILYTIISSSHAPSKGTVPKPKVLIFSVLSLLSLATTWSYMLGFFDWSYTTWLASQPVESTDLLVGHWLRDTELFKQAWGEACSSPGRYWWTHQIFLWTTLWSLFVGHEGRKYGIPGLWRFMLLGQIVAISFASTLFFLALLCNSTRNSKILTSSTTHHTRKFGTRILLASLVCTAFCVYYLPKTVNTPYFLPVLAVPHVLLFIPLYVESNRPTFYYSLVKVMLYVFVVMQAKVTQDVLAAQKLAAENGGLNVMDGVLQRTLREHPAVASVGLDAMYCMVSFGFWVLLEGWF